MAPPGSEVTKEISEWDGDRGLRACPPERLGGAPQAVPQEAPPWWPLPAAPLWLPVQSATLPCVRLRQPSWPWRRAGRCRHLRREARLGRLPGNPRRPRPRLWSSAEHLPPVPLGRWGLETTARPPAPGPQAAAGPSPGRALLHARMTAGPVLWPRLGRVSGVGTRASPRPIGHRHRI